MAGSWKLEAVGDAAVSTCPKGHATVLRDFLGDERAAARYVRRRLRDGHLPADCQTCSPLPQGVQRNGGRPSRSLTRIS